MYDLAVIGAGPVGSYLSSICAKTMDVVVLEEDAEAGKKACSGLVSPRFMEMLPPDVRKPGLVEHTVKAASIHFMGKDFEFRKKGTAAYVLDRDTLDKRMTDHAIRKGADVRFDERVVSIMNSGDVKIRSARHNFESRVVAGCDGARSVAAKTIGSKPMEMLNGLIFYVNKEDYSDYVEMWFDKSLVRDGFFWRIPRGESTEFGCIGYGLSFPLLQKFFRLDDSRISGRTASPVPIGVAKTFGGRILLVGDSACQTKPWSGGGLTYGLMSARHASIVISNAIRTGDFTKLHLYEDGWKRDLLKDINAGLMAREFYKDMDLGALSSIIDKADSLKHESDKIDFDFPFSSAMI